MRPTCTNQYFTCSNDTVPTANPQADWAPQANGNNQLDEGVCAAMSAKFLYLINQNMSYDDIHTHLTSNEGKQNFSHVQYWMESLPGHVNKSKAILGMHELEILANDDIAFGQNAGQLGLWLKKLEKMTGSYYICTDDHAMALVVYADKVIFFDPNEGLFGWQPIGNFSTNLDTYLHTEYSGSNSLEVYMVYPKDLMKGVTAPKVKFDSDSGTGLLHHSFTLPAE